MLRKRLFNHAPDPVASVPGGPFSTPRKKRLWLAAQGHARQLLEQFDPNKEYRPLDGYRKALGTAD
jgi:hypothetical protein